MICKLVKWAVIGTAVVGGAGFLLFGTSLGSYVGTMAASIKEGVVDNIGLLRELQAIRSLYSASDIGICFMLSKATSNELSNRS